MFYSGRDLTPDFCVGNNSVMKPLRCGKSECLQGLVLDWQPEKPGAAFRGAGGYLLWSRASCELGRWFVCCRACGDPQRLVDSWLVVLAHLSPFIPPGGSQGLLWGHSSGYWVIFLASAVRSVHTSPRKVLCFDVVLDVMNKLLCHHFVSKFLLFLHAVSGTR